MPRPTRARLTGLDHLEAREVPAALAAGPLADLTTHRADAFGAFPALAGGDPAVTAGRATYFIAGSADTVNGLFRTDGTPAGTTLVKDLVPPGRQYPGGLPLLAAAGDRVVFTYDDGVSGTEPWVTDGTAAGTRRLADLTPGAAGTFVTNLTPVGGRVVLSVTGPAGMSPAAPPSLWATDGTPAGTVKLTDLSPGYPAAAPAAANGRLYFQQPHYNVSGQYANDLIATDGTPAGTKTVARLPAGVNLDGTYAGAAPWAAATADGTVVFAASDGTAGSEPWSVKPDGTAARLADLNPTGGPAAPMPGFPVPNAGSGPHQAGFAALNGRVYFAADDGTHGVELWATDGTAAGTTLVTDLTPKIGSVDPAAPGTVDPVTGLYTPRPNGSQVRSLTAANGRLYFAADDGSGDGFQLFASDGTAAGTVKLTRLTAPPAPASPYLMTVVPRVVGTAGKAVVFTAAAGDLGPQLFATDGTPAGTVMLPAVGKPAPTTFTTGPQPLATAPGKLYFSADDGVTGRQLWVTDGTAAGTKQAAVVNTATRGSDPRLFTPLGKLGLFAAQTADGSHTGLYATDGTAAPTLLTSTSYTITALAPAGSRAFAVAGDYGTGRKLLVTDGTPAGTVTLLAPTLGTLPQPWPGMPVSTTPGIGNPAAVGGTLYFTVEAEFGVVELWKSDGTRSGTGAVATVSDQSGNTPTSGSAPRVRQLTAVGDKLYFAVNGGADDDVVWVSDGTAAGTRRVKDGGANGQAPDGLTALGGRLYYTAASGDAGRQLWVTDGTAAGTRQAAVINTGARKDDPPLSPYYPAMQSAGPLAAGGKLYLPVADDVTGRQLGVYDPAAGTVTRLTKTGGLPGWLSPTPGVVDSLLLELTAAGDRVYFTAGTAAGTRQVFVTDGSPAGTRVVKELSGGTNSVSLPGGGGPDILTAVGGRVLFAGDDGTHGRELWVTDGTTAGTRLAREFAPGGASGLPTGFTRDTAVVVNNTLLLAASAPATGAEPWAVPLSELLAAGPPVPPATPPVVPPPVPPASPPVPPASPPVTPPSQPASGAGAAVVRTFVVRGTQRETFVGNLATVSLPDAAGYTASVDWGDGKPAAATLTRTTATGKTWTVAAERLLTTAGATAATVTVRRAGGTVLTFAVSVTAAEAKFYAVRVAQRVTAGATFRGAVATVDDLGKGMTAADLTATVDWGDGSRTAGTLVRTAAGKLEVVGEHTFAAAGSRTVTVTVRGVGSTRVQTAASTFTVDPGKSPTVPPPAPAPAGAKFYAIRVAQRVAAGSPFRGAVAVVDDLGQHLTDRDLTATINWGDGATTAGTLRRNAAGVLEVTGEHTFAAAGKPAVRVTVTATAGTRAQTADSLFTVDPARQRV